MRSNWYRAMRWMVLGFSPCYAGVVFDGSVGPKKTLTGPRLDIHAEMGRQMGKNLFHSFSHFDITKAQTVTFNDIGATGPVTNILSRVTGGEPSQINGTLRTDFKATQPDLYLLNPAGILFGPQAHLDLQGAFHVSTADYLRLGERSRFHADLGQRSHFNIAAPAAFGFLENTAPASIHFKGSQLTVPKGKTFSVIGGEVTLNGGSLLKAESGQFNLISVGSAGEAHIEANSIDASAFVTLGRLLIAGTSASRRSGIEVSGSPEGRIVVRGGALVMKDYSILNNVLTDNLAPVNEPDTAIDIKLAGALRMQKRALITVKSGGDTVIQSGLISLVDGAKIQVTSLDPSKVVRPSQLRVKVNQLEIEGVITTSTAIGTNEDLSRIAGLSDTDIYLKTKHLQITNGARLETEQGDLTVTAKTLLLRGTKNTFRAELATNATETGSSGNLSIDAARIDVLDGARISTSTHAFASGDSGRLTLWADQITVSGFSDCNNCFSSIQAETQGINDDSGKGGDLVIRTDQLLINNQANISTTTRGTGDGGSIAIKANRITIKDKGAIKSESRENDSGISGAITLESTQLALENGRITVETLNANAGDIRIDQDGLLSIAEQSEITTSVADGAGNGGNISIGRTSPPALVVLKDASAIIAKALKGNGGRITLVTDALIQAPNSVIDASSAGGGINGTIDIRTPEAKAIAATLPLDTDFINVASLLDVPCSAKHASKIGSLVINQRDGMAPEPDQLLPVNVMIKSEN